MIYLPVSCRILTPGHIKIIKHLLKEDKVIVGLLTRKAMEGYKEEIMPYKDRLFILENLDLNVRVVAQKSLNPKRNLKKYKCTAIASGDGWEQSEVDAVNELDIEMIDVKLPGEKKKKYSSSKILNI